MSKGSNFIKVITFIISVAAFVFSGISFFKSCSSEKELKKTNYALSAVVHRPRLKLYNPQISELNFRTDTFPVYNNTQSEDTIVDIKVFIDFKLNISVKNIGNHTAKIVGMVYADTTSEEQMLKDIILKKRGIKEDESGSKLFPYQFKDLISQDTSYIEINHTPQHIKNKKFCIHILLLYENELGQLFDTYYWLYFDSKAIIIPSPYAFKYDTSMRKKVASEIMKLAILRDENNFSSLYTEEQAEEFLNCLKE